MKRRLILATALLAIGGLGWLGAGTAPTPAAEPTPRGQTADVQAVFAISNMTCALCPITVKKAMEGVAGVKSVAVDFDAKTATVVFDPAVTNADAIAAASTNAGYPAAVGG
ncbi:MAG: hypothetical protein Kow00104_08590 [Rhodothalassiaceae bacterium]